MHTLTSEQAEQVSGGVYPVLVVAASLFTFGYKVGKDMAERDDRAES